jgi:hypothetical protein
MAYVRYNNDWKTGAAGGTPITEAALDQIELGLTKMPYGPDFSTDNVPVWNGSAWAAQTLVNAQISASAAIARSKLAVQARRYPVQLHTPRSSSLAGNSFWTVLALTDYDAGHWEYVKDVDGIIYGQVTIPKILAPTANAKLLFDIAANATSGVTRLEVASKSVADGVTLNPGSLTTETAQDITVPGTAYFRKVVTFTLTETVAADSFLIVKATHRGAHANDTLAVNTLLFGVWLEVDVA